MQTFYYAAIMIKRIGRFTSKYLWENPFLPACAFTVGLPAADGDAVGGPQLMGVRDTVAAALGDPNDPPAGAKADCLAFRHFL